MPSPAALSPRRRLASIAVAAILGGLAGAGCTMAQEPWPNLTDALAHLDAAVEALHQAPDRFGGHKAEAIRLIREAYNEIEIAKVAYR